MQEERGMDGWIALVLILSIILFVMGLNFDFRHEWNKKDLFSETVQSVQRDFELAGGMTAEIENEIIQRLDRAGINTSSIMIEGSPVSNYGEKIYYLVTLDTMMKVGSEEHAKTYKKKVVGTSAYVPFS